MTRTRKLALFFVAIAAAASIAACGGGSTAAGPSTGSSAPSGTVATGNVKLTIKNFMFSPMSVHIKAGSSITWTNDDSVTHTATGTGNSAFINSGNLPQGKSYTVKFSKAGTYNYICDIHQYMMGTIVVSS